MILSTGLKQNFNFLGNYSSLNKNLLYTVTGLRDIKDFTSMEIDIFNEAYDKYGVNETVYESDLEENVRIAILVNDINRIYIPEKHITFQTVKKYTYIRKVFVVDVGPMQSETDLTNALQTISGGVLDKLGVTPSIKVIETTEPQDIDEATHLGIVASRNANMSDGNLLAEIRRLNDIIADKDSTIADLNCIVKTLYMP